MDDKRKTDAMYGDGFRSREGQGADARVGRGLVDTLRREEAEGRATPSPGARGREPANERQYGGDHYRAEYQHWDMVHDVRMGYFNGCASKYVGRHRRKNGPEDLAKAMHFCEKAIELGLDRSNADVSRDPASYEHYVHRYADHAQLTNGEYQIVRLLAADNYMDALGGIADLLDRMPAKKNAFNEG